jgi:hypothetical protein
VTPATPAPAPVAPSDGPTFTAVFSDGIETKMSIYSSADENNLDAARAVAVSRAAYSSRAKVPMAEITATITYARFDNVRGMLLASYSAADLAKAVAP